MRARFLAFLFMLLAPLFFFSGHAAAQNGGRLLSTDLADDTIDITTGFNGARLSVFGVRKETGDIAIVIQGPPRPVLVRRKSQIMGMWINADSMRFRNVPSYYDIALSKPEELLAPASLRQAYGIGLNALNFDPVAGKDEKEKVGRFREALIRNKQGEGHFLLEPKTVIFMSDNFFRADLYVPADLPTGDYTVKTYLFQDGAVADVTGMKLRVAQVGFSARLYMFAHGHGLFYGFFAVLLALAAGGSARLFMRRD